MLTDCHFNIVHMLLKTECYNTVRYCW